jgi:hypothetical protein
VSWVGHGRIAIRSPGRLNEVTIVQMIGIGHVAVGSIGSGPAVQTVAGMGWVVRRDAVAAGRGVRGRLVRLVVAAVG